MNFKKAIISFFLMLFVQQVSAQVMPINKATKIYLSSHTPMWTATIDLKAKTFSTITNDGMQISKKIQLVKKNNTSVIIKSEDGSLYIKLYRTKNCDCTYDIPEKEASQWNAEISLNKKKSKVCAYWE